MPEEDNGSSLIVSLPTPNDKLTIQEGATVLVVKDHSYEAIVEFRNCNRQMFDWSRNVLPCIWHFDQTTAHSPTCKLRRTESYLALILQQCSLLLGSCQLSFPCLHMKGKSMKSTLCSFRILGLWASARIWNMQTYYFLHLTQKSISG